MVIQDKRVNYWTVTFVVETFISLITDTPINLDTTFQQPKQFLLISTVKRDGGEHYNERSIQKDGTSPRNQSNIATEDIITWALIS